MRTTSKLEIRESDDAAMRSSKAALIIVAQRVFPEDG